MKKRYWRLSLLIHPDKCDHPQAHDAFQAVTAAAKELQARSRWVPGTARRAMLPPWSKSRLPMPRCAAIAALPMSILRIAGPPPGPT